MKSIVETTTECNGIKATDSIKAERNSMQFALFPTASLSACICLAEGCWESALNLPSSQYSFTITFSYILKFSFFCC